MAIYRSHHASRMALALLGIFAVGAGGLTATYAGNSTELGQDANVRVRQHDARMQWRSLTPEQREAATASAKGVYDEVSPEAKAAWQQLTPEQQEGAIAEAEAWGRAWGQRVKADQKALSQEQKVQIKEENRAIRQERRTKRTESQDVSQ